ncbi:MAG: hypothetical protein AAGI71_02630 [Bacteroidota bacterium]
MLSGLENLIQNLSGRTFDPLVIQAEFDVTEHLVRVSQLWIVQKRTPVGGGSLFSIEVEQEL